MNDLYREILVKHPATGTDMFKKIGVIALTAVLAAAGLLIHPLLFLPAIGAGVFAWSVITGLDLEYEYLYVHGDFDIDKIMNRQRRKRVASYTLEELELLAPSGSHDLDPYSGKGQVLDYTSGDPNVKTYVAVYNTSRGIKLVRLELDNDILRDLRRLAPRKISREIMLLPG